MIRKPQNSEYNPFYETYVSKVDGDSVVDELRSQLSYATSFFEGLTDEQTEYAYASGKWNIKELLNHMNDAERVFSYRALCIARGEDQSLPGMDQDIYQNNSKSELRTMSSLISEFQAVRNATIAFFENLNEEDSLRMGKASGFPVSVRALGTIIVGHMAHHLQVINERYL